MTIRRVAAPAGAKVSSVYTATVRGLSEGTTTAVHIYEIPKSGHFVSFQTDEPVEVKVTYTGVTITAAEAIGRSFDVTDGTDRTLSGTFTGSAYTVTLDAATKNGYYTVDFNGNYLQEELTSKAPFIILANPLETVPTASGTVKVLSPGWWYIDGAGAIQSGNSTPSNLYYSIPQGNTLYVQDGAILRGKVRIGSDTEGGGGVTAATLGGLGQIDASYIASPNEGRPLRINQSSGVTVDGPIFVSGFHWGVVARKCTGATITNIKTFAHRTGVTLAGTPDGMDMVGSSNITVSKFFSRSYDDGATIKSAMPDGTWAAAVSNVNYTNGVIYQGWAGNGVEVGYEIPQNISSSSFKNITICRKLARNADTVNRDALSILLQGAGNVSGIMFENIVVHYCEERYIGFQADTGGGDISGVVVKNVEFKQNAKDLAITVTGAGSTQTVTNTSFQQLKFADDVDVSSSADVLFVTNGFATGTTFTGAPATPVTLGAAHDAWVKGDSTQNGTATTLVVKNSVDNTLDRKTFLRFDATGAGLSSVTSAKLRLYCTALDGAAAITAYPVSDDTWTETGVAWPGPSNGSPIVATTVSAAGAYYEWDVTSYVNSELAGNKLISFLLFDATVADKLITFSSDESASNKPQLMLTP